MTPALSPAPASEALVGSLPFFKWAGGKRRQVGAILDLLRLGDGARRYHEPFLGGGAMFLAARGLHEGPCVLNDLCPTVAATWSAVKNDPEGVIRAFRARADRDSRSYYFGVRKQPPPLADAVARAGWFLYLNKAGFNGLWRENSRGEYNVPYGDGKRPTLDEDRVRAASQALAGADVCCGDFERAPAPGDGDVVYCDPPYLPASATASFSAYTRGGFSPGSHIRLAHWCRAAADRGARVVLSSSGTSDAVRATRDLADDVVNLTAARSISCKGDRRDPVTEYLFLFRRSP